MTESLSIWVVIKVKFWRFLATASNFFKALDYTSFDYTLDRIERLERKVMGLAEELRQIRASSSGDAETK